MTTEHPRGLTVAQVEALLRPVPKGITDEKGKLTYVPAHEVKAMLTRVFGPGNWDHTIHDVRLLWEDSGPSADGKKTMYRACYAVACTLRVRDYWGNPIFETTEYHAEANSNLPDRGEAHAMALTSCESYALRRAALDLGDAAGLHLYNAGSMVPLVKGTGLLLDPASPMHEAYLEAQKKRQEAQAKSAQRALEDGAGATKVEGE